jgi:DNA-binding transcriptional ArsR family regulator
LIAGLAARKSKEIESCAILRVSFRSCQFKTECEIFKARVSQSQAMRRRTMQTMTALAPNTIAACEAENERRSDLKAAPKWEYVAEVPRAAALLHPLRLRILQALDEPDSASGVARRLMLPAQKVNYHVRRLARARFIECISENSPRKNAERRYRKTAQAYVLSPELLGENGQPESGVATAFTPSQLVGVLAFAQSELGRSIRDAETRDERFPSLTIQTPIRLGHDDLRAQFAEELRRAVAEVVARYSAFESDECDRSGAPHSSRLILCCYPIPANHYLPPAELPEEPRPAKLPVPTPSLATSI